MKYDLLSSQHRQQLRGALKAVCHGGKGIVWLGIVSSDGHKV